MIINKTIVPTLLVLLIWYLTAKLSVGMGSSCDVVGKPCFYPQTLIDIAFLSGPLIGGLYIFFVSRDFKFALIFCGIFYILLIIFKSFLGF